MDGIRKTRGLELQVIATGMHLSPEFGLTYRGIEDDGFDIDTKIEMLLSADTPAALAKSMGLGLIGFGEAWQRLTPYLLFLLGDRFEIFSAAAAATVARIPIAHAHGGETTEGSFDEAMRHSITKMSHLHFVAAEQYRKRVIQLGEAHVGVSRFLAHEAGDSCRWEFRKPGVPHDREAEGLQISGPGGGVRQGS